jgi:hypothetical protein
MLGAPPALAGRFKLDDERPWKKWMVLTAMRSEAIRNIGWIIPLKDGKKLQNFQQESKGIVIHQRNSRDQTRRIETKSS